MAQCKQTAQEFIQSAFSPQLGVLCSADAEALCQKNNLSFVQLVQPFCRLSTEAHIRDPNNVPHPIHNLKVSMKDMTSQPPHQPLARKLLTDAVANVQPQLVDGNRGNVISVGDYDLQLNDAPADSLDFYHEMQRIQEISTPWYEAYRECFLQVMAPTDHEFLNHSLGALFVVSSNHSDPIGTFTSLAQQQLQIQSSGKLPKWFCPNILKYYVLIHDVIEGEQAKADAIYQSMKTTFGAHACHLLQINSRSQHTADAIKHDANMPDPWSQFLQKIPENNEAAEFEVGISSQDDAGFPSQLSEGNAEVDDSSTPGIQETVEPANEVFEGTVENGNLAGSEVFHHPLAPQTNNITATQNNEPSSFNEAGPATSEGEGPDKTANIAEKKTGAHGMCLTMSDHDRMRIFMHEFLVRALIPWAERQMRVLNDQATSRKGLHRSFFSATKNWFGSGNTTGKAAANQSTTVVYNQDAPELHMRRMADLAFLFQMYNFAHHTYQTSKRDFKNDHARLHHAGALEMSAISLFMVASPGQRQYPYPNMELAITTYLTVCSNIQLAARATMMSTEALKSRGMYAEAAMQFIKMTSEDSDLRSALLLEQAAHCFINMKAPMLRKYSFHMILSGHRFSKSGQRKHALRAYSQALQVYKGKNWTLAEDHINFTIGRQSFNLKQLENATAAFKHLLSRESRQTIPQQSAFLREYLFVYKQQLNQGVSDGGMYMGPLPELPLPVVDNPDTKVILDGIVSSTQAERVSGVSFHQNDHTDKIWRDLEVRLLKAVNGGTLPTGFQPTMQCFTNTTDNHDNPVSYVGETITVAVQLSNPLKITLVMSDVTLLWNFISNIDSEIQEHVKPQVIGNEVTSVKNNLSDEIVHTHVNREVIIHGSQTEVVHLSLMPQQIGSLRIVGIAYNLGSSQTGTTNDALSHKSSYASTIYVRGKQRLEVQGPRLNNSKEEKVNKMYGPDRRLDLEIRSEMPFLQVSLCDFPEMMLCGEVHRMAIDFTNVGSLPLQNLKVATSNPEFFTFGCQGSHPDSCYVYSTDSCKACSDSSDMIHRTVAMKTPVSVVVDIPIPGGTLQPKSTINLPLWIRGHDIGGKQEIYFVFYYESLEKKTKSSYRILHHTATVNTIESLCARVISQRGNICSQQSHRELRSCVLSCELENLSQGTKYSQWRSRNDVVSIQLALYGLIPGSNQSAELQVQKVVAKEIQITQVSCASQNWSIDYLSLQPNTDIRIAGRQMMHLCLKATKHHAEENQSLSASQMCFSNVTFSEDQIESSQTPCLDFYCRSQYHKRSSSSSQSKRVKERADFSDLNAAIEVGLTLIILWKAEVSSDSGAVNTLVGQHHVTIDTIDTVSLSYPTVVVPQEQAPIKLIRDLDANPEPQPDISVLSQLVQYSFSHPAHISHDFDASGLCVLPVELVLHNSSKVTVHASVDTCKDRDRSNSDKDIPSNATPSSQTLQTSPGNTFSWAGPTVSEFQLEPQEFKTVKLNACICRPGAYNLNQLSVFMSRSLTKTELILQKHSSPSVIVVSSVS